MSFRLVNQNDPDKILGISRQTWYGILDLAEEHGWNPMGTIQTGARGEVESIEDRWPDYRSGQWPDSWSYEKPLMLNGSYTEEGISLVLFEDALNFADALEQAFTVYEPEWNWLYRFEDNPFSMPSRQFKPSIGAISLVINFCREGTFYIERH